MFVNKNTAIILIISTILFSIKWILSFYFFNESLSIRIIFESVSDGWLYYPFIKYLAFFEFSRFWSLSLVQGAAIYLFGVSVFVEYMSNFEIMFAAINMFVIAPA